MTFTTRPVRVYADWQILGDEDVDGAEHVSYYFEQASMAGLVTDFDLLVATGEGLSYVFFAANMQMNAEQLNNPKKEAKKLFDSIVCDTDVEVRWVSRV